MVDRDAIAELSEECFAVCPLGMMGFHDINNRLEVLASVYRLTDLLGATSALHIEPATVRVGEVL